MAENTTTSENTTTFTDGNFDESVIKSSLPVLVDFWAEWCGPCRMIAPTVTALASENTGKLTVGKLNVDDNPNTAMQFGVRSIPTLLLFKGGEVVESVVGLTDKNRLQALVDKHIGD
jgi:thioredoxin 1